MGPVLPPGSFSTGLCFEISIFADTADFAVCVLCSCGRAAGADNESKHTGSVLRPLVEASRSGCSDVCIDVIVVGMYERPDGER